MKFNLKEAIEWQESDNAQWFTNIMPKCDICGCEVKAVFEFKENKNNKNSIKACFDAKKSCQIYAIKTIFNQNSTLEFIWTRGLFFKELPSKKEKISLPDLNNQKIDDQEQKYTLRQLRGAWAAGKNSRD